MLKVDNKKYLNIDQISKFVQAKFFQKSEYPLFFGISRNSLGKVIKRKEKDFLPTPFQKYSGKFAKKK